MDIEAVFELWLNHARELVEGVELFDAHTHIGHNDPDGFHQSAAELLHGLRAAGACGCFVFPMHEPDGYRHANEVVISQARAAGGLLTPFCRVKPGEDALREAERALERGARGIKLHPRAERFTLDHPDVRELFALANERSLPILIHAGRGIPSLGAHVVKLVREFPNARAILAHAGACDLAWIWRAAADLPNLLFDTSWWLTGDLLALFALVPPGQLLFASDAPYGSTAAAGAAQVRLMLQAGLSDAQVRLACAGQSRRLAACEPPAAAGGPLGEHERAEHLLLARVAAMIQVGAIMQARGGDGAEMLSLARLACDVPDELDDAPVFAAVRALLDAYDAARPTSAVAGTDPRALSDHPTSVTVRSSIKPPASIDPPASINPPASIDPLASTDRRWLALLLLAVAVASTPDVPLPARVELPDQA